MHDLLEGADDGCMRAGIRRGSGGRRQEAVQQGQELGDGELQHGVELNGDSRCSSSNQRAWCN